MNIQALWSQRPFPLTALIFFIFIFVFAFAFVSNSLAEDKFQRYCRLAHGKVTINAQGKVICDDGFPDNGKSTWNPNAFKAVYGTLPPRDTWAVNAASKRKAEAKSKNTTTDSKQKVEKDPRAVTPEKDSQTKAKVSATAPTGPAAASLKPVLQSGLGNRVALVIGISDYKNVPTLPNPIRDAAMIASTLQRIGFQTVILDNNLSREKLIDALRSFARDAERADWALVYFAGHGIQLGGTNYLVPVDATLETDRDLSFEAVPLDQALSSVEGAKTLRIVLLDACRDNPFTRQMRRTVATRSIGRGLAKVEPDAGTLVVYAAKDGETALDGDGANSPFASALAKNLTTPGIEIRKLFDLVRDDVMDATQRRQQPFTYGSISGRQDFYFVQR